MIARALIIFVFAAVAPERAEIEEIRTLKADERNLLDELDDLYAERDRLDADANKRKAELSAIRQVLMREEAQVAVDRRAALEQATIARKTARALQRLARGGGLRFVLAADSWGASLRRLRQLEQGLRHDVALLRSADASLNESSERAADWQRDAEYAEALSTDVAIMQQHLATKNATITKALAEVRGARATHEHALYELKESAAEEPTDEERAALNDVFVKQRGSLPWPVRGAVKRSHGRQVDSVFGTVTQAAGVVIAAHAGEAVATVAPGKVVAMSTVPGYGRVVIVQHSAHYYSVYGHLGNAIVRVGETVRQGQTVAMLTESGELFFDIRRRAVGEDPLVWLSQ